MHTNECSKINTVDDVGENEKNKKQTNIIDKKGKGRCGAVHALTHSLLTLTATFMLKS